MRRRRRIKPLKIPPAELLPPYKIIKQAVAQKIASGQLVAGDRVPSDNELSASFQVSRLTAHRALRELAQEGLVHRVHGIGTFVLARKETSPAAKIYNIAEDVRVAGKAFRSQILDIASVACSSELATAMEVAKGKNLFHSRIVYYADEQPLQLEDRFVLPDFAPHYLDQDFNACSTTDYLQSIAPADEAEQVIEAVMPDAAVKKLLKTSKGEACLVVIRKTWVAHRVTTYTRFLHPGSRRRLVSRIRRPADADANPASGFGVIES